MVTRARRTTAAVFAAAAAISVGSTATAAAVQDPIPIRPNTSFTGTANGQGDGAVIKVVCPGPIYSGRTGHPVAGQVVEVDEVTTPISSLPGYTGSLADTIRASFTLPTSVTANPPIVLTSYFAPVAIPVTLDLPCGGSGELTFSPYPTSSTARDYKITVNFVNIAA